MIFFLLDFLISFPRLSRLLSFSQRLMRWPESVVCRPLGSKLLGARLNGIVGERSETEVQQYVVGSTCSDSQYIESGCGRGGVVMALGSRLCVGWRMVVDVMRARKGSPVVHTLVRLNRQ